MTCFRYQALDIGGRSFDGQLDTASRAAAIGQLQAQRLLVISVEDHPAGWSAERHGWKKNVLSAQAISRLTQQLATLLQAGQSLERALGTLLRQPGHANVTYLLTRIRDRVKNGLALSAALAQENGQFSSLYLSVVRAGEAGGSLAEALSQLATYLDRWQDVRNEVINALIYPAFLVIGVLGSLVLLLTYVVPEFVPVFQGLGVQIPVITQVILDVGIFLADYGALLLVGATGVLVTFSLRLRRPEQRMQFDRRVLRLRMIGHLWQLLETARLSRTLGTLLRHGVPLLTGLSIAQDVCSNRAIRAAVVTASRGVQEGGLLSSALIAENVLPDLALQMIQVGEESGQLDQMLLNVADVFDREAKRAIDRLLAALVPTLTLVMTALVAFIMMAIMLPLMSLTSNL